MGIDIEETQVIFEEFGLSSKVERKICIGIQREVELPNADVWWQ